LWGEADYSALLERRINTVTSVVRTHPERRQYYLGEHISRSIEVEAVQQQEDDRHHCADPFIFAKKGMVLDEVKKR